MREIEMRQRLERLVETAVRRAAMPAALGVTLALSACSGEGKYMAPVPGPDEDAGNSGAKDAGTGGAQGSNFNPTPVYMAPMTDAGTPDPGQNAGGSGGAAAAADAGPVAKYMAQLPDAGLVDGGLVDGGLVDGGLVDGGASDAGPQPATDAGPGPAMRYMAQMPDAGTRSDLPVPVYMALMPRSG